MDMPPNMDHQQEVKDLGPVAEQAFVMLRDMHKYSGDAGHVGDYANNEKNVVNFFTKNTELYSLFKEVTKILGGEDIITVYLANPQAFEDEVYAKIKGYATINN